MKTSSIILALTCFLLVACQPSTSEEDARIAIPEGEAQAAMPEETTAVIPTKVIAQKTDPSRDEILARLQQKIKDRQDLVVHVFVPLCDNEHQGIVPVSTSLGDGFNPRSNLYWGALYGVKTHLKKHANWKYLGEEKQVVQDIILERVVFRKTIGKRHVYVVADAYRGDKMEACLNHLMQSISGQKSDTTNIGGQSIGIYSSADLLVFNGHNGLMDMDVPAQQDVNQRGTDVMAIACASHGYFTAKFKKNGGYPLLLTTNLLAPEAYVLEAAISTWALGKDGKTVADAAGRAYNQYQKCGYKGARRLFNRGGKP